VLEHEEICVWQAFYRLEAQDAHTRIEHKILPLFPGLAAGTAGLERMAFLVFFFRIAHRGILRPNHLQRQIIMEGASPQAAVFRQPFTGKSGMTKKKNHEDPKDHKVEIVWNYFFKVRDSNL
jgi:hypothetical protein